MVFPQLSTELFHYQNHSYTIPWLAIANGQMLGSWYADTVCLHAYQLFSSFFALCHLSISICCLLSYTFSLSSGSGDCLLNSFSFVNRAASTGVLVHDCHLLGTV